MTNLPPFYPTQKVVCIREGDPNGVCEDGPWLIKKGQHCVVMDIEYNEDDGTGVPAWYIELNVDKGCVYHAENFAPITENFQSISLVKVLETETPLISVN